jgi:endonuclease/exonuclease/phosphatase (EEP) superfamily protein YafD
MESERIRKGLFSISILVAILLVVIDYGNGYLLRLANSLSPILAALTLPIFLLGIWFRIRQLFIFTASLLCLSIANFMQASLYTPLSTKEPSIRIIHSNLYHHNPESGESVKSVVAYGADIVGLQELNSRWPNNWSESMTHLYPFKVLLAADTCCYGIGLFSKHPIIASQIAYSQGVPYIIATVSVRGQELTIISLHALPPVFPNQIKERNLQIKEISQIASKIDGPLIVLGDFNVVHWDRIFQNFLKASGLSKVSNGFQPTFPMDFGVPLIPIDHITYSQGLIPTTCETFNVPGSDHKGIVAEFAFSSQ